MKRPFTAMRYVSVSWKVTAVSFLFSFHYKKGDVGNVKTFLVKRLGILKICLDVFAFSHHLIFLSQTYVSLLALTSKDDLCILFAGGVLNLAPLRIFR